MSPRYNLMGFVLIWFLIISPISSADLKDIKLVYSTWRKDGSQDIYLIEDINLKHLKPIRLTQHPAPDFHPRWSPDGKNIVFVSRRDGNDEIYIMDITSGEIERLTHNPARDLEPAWSPKGRKIAFISNRDPGNSGGIYVMDLPSRKITYLTPNMPSANGVAWTPDGRRIAFVSHRGRGDILSLIDIASREVKKQTLLPSNYCHGFCLSPDGTKVTFSSDHEGGQFDIFTMDLSGGNLRNLTENTALFEWDPCWTPDGRFIAFSSNRKGSFDGNDIYFMTLEGEIVKQLKLEGYNLEPDVFDPNYKYPVSPLIDLRMLMWGMIKRGAIR
ncbi:PD40 domain-containing protein [Candidatus Poribacteria bacterium]|nr:PD40 domain-containing protein [Candidatus Poribacteria bacterium]